MSVLTRCSDQKLKRLFFFQLAQIIIKHTFMYSFSSQGLCEMYVLLVNLIALNYFVLEAGSLDPTAV